jgi:PAS domain S-box-containing protein
MEWLKQCLGPLRGRLARAIGTPDFDELPVALIQLDESGAMVRGNRGWEVLSGHRVRECLGLDHREFLHIEDRGLWQQAMHDLSVGMPPWIGSLRYLGRGGELYWVEARLVRRTGGYVASLADISAQVPRNQQLQAGYRSLSNLLDGLPLMVYRCRNNRQWTMEYVSAGCLELTGYAPHALVDSQSLTFNSLIHPEDRGRIWRLVQEGVRSARPFSFDYRLLCADGSEKAVSERGRGIYSDLGDLLGLEGVVMPREGESAYLQEVVAGFY